MIGSLTNNAKVSPGLSAGTLTIATNYVELPGAVLEIELGELTPGSGYDRLVVTGAVSLAGTLNVSLVNGFAPPAGSSYRIVTAGALSGVFAATNYPPGVPGLTLEYAPDGVTLRVIDSSPTSITETMTNGGMLLSWPLDHMGWRLVAQTNAPGLGLTTNWSTVAGSKDTNQCFVPISQTKGSVFVRLVYP